MPEKQELYEQKKIEYTPVITKTSLFANKRLSAKTICH